MMLDDEYREFEDDVYDFIERKLGPKFMEPISDNPGYHGNLDRGYTYGPAEIVGRYKRIEADILKRIAENVSETLVLEKYGKIKHQIVGKVSEMIEPILYKKVIDHIELWLNTHLLELVRTVYLEEKQLKVNDTIDPIGQNLPVHVPEQTKPDA